MAFGILNGMATAPEPLATPCTRVVADEPSYQRRAIDSKGLKPVTVAVTDVPTRPDDRPAFVGLRHLQNLRQSTHAPAETLTIAHT